MPSRKCYFGGWSICQIWEWSNTFIQTLRWRHNDRDGVSNHQPYHCLLNRLFRRRSEKTSKIRVTGLCARNSPVTGEFPAQKASNAENVSIWWRHHEIWHLRNLRDLTTSRPQCVEFYASQLCYFFGMRKMEFNILIWYHTHCNIHFLFLAVVPVNRLRRIRTSIIMHNTSD